MEAKNFRIGNLIEADKNIISIGIIKENFITWNVAKYPTNKVWNPFLPTNDPRLKPIKLTNEWLKKLCFVHDLDTNTFCLKPITLYKQDGIFWCDILWDSLEIKSVHQLQNLFFALTGTELTVKHEVSV